MRDAALRWFDDYGVPPSSVDWNAGAFRARADPRVSEERWQRGCWPSSTHVIVTLGLRWTEFLQSLGFPPDATLQKPVVASRVCGACGATFTRDPKAPLDAFKKRAGCSYVCSLRLGEKGGVDRSPAARLRVAVELRERGMLDGEIAAEMGLAKSTVAMILSRGRVAGEAVPRSPRRAWEFPKERKLSEEQVTAIRAALAEGATQESQARQYGVSQPHISRRVAYRS